MMLVIPTIEDIGVYLQIRLDRYTTLSASAKTGFSPGATVVQVASGRRRCALGFLLTSTAHTWSQHPGCAQMLPVQHRPDRIHLMHPQSQLCPWYTRRPHGNQPVRGTYQATD